MPLRLTPAVKAGCGRASHLRTRTLAVRRVRLQAQGGQVALPHQRVQARSRWIKASRLYTLIPRDSDRWRELYRGRAAVEREFGRLEARREPADHPRARYRAGPGYTPT
jgi:hypothetical protein